ncbi:MAG TPA: hypothetical protein VL418_05395 [Devosiaceae bacterium]|nr:hypothetical protein [Devosiaceae bacterium]
MSEASSLTELARFAGKSKLNSDNAETRRRAIEAIAVGLQPRLQQRGVADLLGVVLVLSARTRRMVLPQVDIDIDVFSPGGGRALRLILPRT